MDFDALQANYSPVDLGYAQQAPQRGQSRGAGGFLGGIVGGIVNPFAKFINQGILQGAQIYDTGRMLTAQATDNDEAWRRANQAAQQRTKMFGDTGGLLNKGTITNAQETARGDFMTGAKKIGGTTAMIGATLAPVGKAATVLGKGAQAAGVGATYGAGEAFSRGGSLEEALTGGIKSAAIGGVIGAGPLNLLRGAAGGGKAAIMGDDVLSAAGRAANKPLTRKAGQALTGAADDLAVKNFRLTPTQLKNFQSKFGEDAGQTIQKYGFNNVDDIATKGIEPLQQQFDQAITGITGVTKEALKTNLTKRIEKLKSSGPSDSQAIGAQLQKEADTILKRYGDVIDANELNSIRRQFDDLVNYTEKTTNPSRYGVNKRMADGIRETLQQSDQTGSLKTVGRELQKLRQLQDNAAKQSQLGRGSLPMNLPTLLGGGMGAAAGGPVGAVGMAVGTAAVNSPTGRRAAMKGAASLGSKLSNAGSRQPGIGRELLARGASIGVAQSQPEQPEPQTLESQLMVDQPTGNETPQVPESQNPYSRENLMADIQRDPENANDYIKYYSMLEEVYNPQQANQKPLSQGQQERADLIQALDNTEGLMSQGSINYGPIGSRIEGIKATFNAADPETLAFKNTVSGLRAAITKARAGASLTPGELKMLAQYTPSDTDSEQMVRSKLTQLRSLYGYQAPTGGGTTIEDMLTQQQPAY